jgi:prolyl-tRNA synthetase
VDVLLDDRADKKTGFGVKVKDFELIGMNYAIVVGNDIDEGNVELITRKDLSKETVAIDKVVEIIMEKLA